MRAQFQSDGYAVFDFDPLIKRWAQAALPIALSAAENPANSDWVRSGRTWFVGVDTLPVDDAGQIENSPKLVGQGPDFCRQLCSADWAGWGAGQGSICYPDYPKKDVGESDAAYAYRKYRSSAHLDGLKPTGRNRRRHFDEFHSFIFGIPLTENVAGAAPFVIWKGSHLIFQKMMWDVYAHLPPDEWEGVDITNVYQETRARIFEICERVEIAIPVGHCYLAHRFSLHGVAPWTAEPNAAEYRAIAYFRPYWQGNWYKWLSL